MRTLYVAAASMMVGAVISGITIQRLAAQAKPPVYFIVENEITDEASYLKEYATHVGI